MSPMTIETGLASAMSSSELRERRDHYDRACKRILSEKDVLGWILHDCLEEFKDVPPTEIASRLIDGDPEVCSTPVHADDAVGTLVTGIGTEDTSVDEGTVWYDIRFRVLVPGTDNHIGMIVNVEAQGNFYPGYPLLKRAAYYCGRMLSAQYGRVFKGSHYEKVQKVCSIWICPDPPTSMRNTITSYAMTERNLVGQAKRDTREYDLVEIVLVCPDGDRQNEGEGLLRLLGTLLASDKDVDERKAIVANEFGIPMSQRLSDEVSEMGNWLSKGLEEKWYREGAEEGHARGVEEGRELQRERIARLAGVLEREGRLSELLTALADSELFERLCEELELDE